jgi:threonine/homoserine/homoserine lactone efflux protein
MTTAIGILSIVFGIVCILWGDKDIKAKDGLILKAFSWRKGSAKWLKWPMGIALIYTGVRIIFQT